MFDGGPSGGQRPDAIPSTIREVTEADAGKGVTRPKDYRDVDGLVTKERRLALVTGHADCNAVFFFDPAKQVIGLAHSGWRGTLGGIGRAMVQTMASRYGCEPEDILAGIGPSLCQECFEVDQDVAQAFFDAEPWRTGSSAGSGASNLTST